MKNFTKAFALCLALLLCLSFPVGVSAAEVENATIDASAKGSLTVYKYNLSGAEKDGVWDSSYVSTGVADQTVIDTLKNYTLQGVEFTYLRVADVVQFTESAGDGVDFDHVEVLYGIDKTKGAALLSAIGLTDGAKRYENADHLDSGKYYYQADALIAALEANATTVKNALKAYMVGESGTGKSGVLHHYYACQTRRKSRTCKKETVRRDWIEEKVVELTKNVVLQDDVIQWIADNAVKFQQQARSESDVGLIEQSLAENRKSQNNIMAAIEAGIFTPTTKNRLMEVEANITQLEKSLAIAKAKNVQIDREKIVFSLEKYRNGDIHDKKYQKNMIDSFVKKVILFDDKIEIHYYYGEKQTIQFGSAENDGIKADVISGSYKLSLGLPETPLWGSDKR